MYLTIRCRFVMKLCETTSLKSRINSTAVRRVHSKMNQFTAADYSGLPTQHLQSKSSIRFNNVGKSQQDDRHYRGLQLENGMKVLLVSDAETEKSAAALTVDVGHMSDPKHVPGLAHFCEHMLFLGTTKYPNENEYSTFLSTNGGSSNAATYADNTKYYFDVVPDSLDGALDRFAQFFIAPLFTESATDREINAVHSEHEKNLAIDAWRIRQVNKFLTDPEHPYHQFGSGNKKTLIDDPAANDINIRDELIKFHNEWYSANIMCLCVYGRESLDELEEMVLAKFSEIINKNVVAPRWTNHPMLPEHYAKKVFIVPIKDSRTLTITFPVGDLDQYYRSGPETYLSHLIGHECKGSILSELKDRGWCNSLMAGYSTSARGFGFFDVLVDLTQDGFENVDEITKIIFQYINMLKEVKPQKWIFEEYCNLSEMQFRFKDKETPLSLASNVVHSMQLYPLEEVLTAPYLLSEWRADLIEQLLEQLVPDKCRIIVTGQKLEERADSIEYWYKTKYSTESIPDDILMSWKNCGKNTNLKLPQPNLFIPTDFNLYPTVDGDLQKFPTVIYDTDVMRLWFKQDTEFLKPKTIMNFDFTSPLAYADPLNCNLTHMFVQLFKDQLNELLYGAELAGLRLRVANTANGISLSISGYSHKQQVLLQKILDQLFDFKFESNRFEIIKEQLLRALKNFKAEQPYQHAVYYLALILTEHAWTKQELIDAIELTTEDRLKQFINDFLSRMHIECFIHGNANKQKALDIAGIVEQKLRTTNSMTLPLLSRQLQLKREYKLKRNESYIFETENEFHKSSCAELYLQCGVQTDESNIFIDLVAQILSEPFYNTLRTKEQLGYIVFCGARKANGVQGIRFIVQSSKHPKYVEQRIELFLTSMPEQIESMPTDEFERHKEALAAQKVERPKRLSTQFNKFLNEISLQQYHFERAESEVAILRKITKEDLLTYYRNFILAGGLARQTLSIHILSTAEDGAGQTDANESTEQTKHDEEDEATTTTAATEHSDADDSKRKIVINDLATFKSSKELYPIVQPYINIQPKGGRSKL